MRNLVSVAALALAFSTASARAADILAPPPPALAAAPQQPHLTFYAGLNLGGGWSANNSNYTNDSAGVLGGGQIGFNFQFAPRFLVGAEADFQGTSLSSNTNGAVFPGAIAGGFIPFSPNGGANLPWFGTVRGRAGFLLAPSILVYGTGGFAYGDVENGWTGLANTRTGWTAGGGIAWLFAHNWSLKLEYLYVNLAQSGNGGWAWGGGRRDAQFNVVRAGLNYHFNGGGSAPIIASY